MFKNIKTNLKRVACAGLSVLVLLASGCKKQIPDFDYAAEDLSSYVTLFDESAYTREMIESEYKKAMMEKESKDSYIINAGSYFDFYVTAYVKNGDNFDRYEKFCYETYGSPVNDYRVLANAENADFDKCLMANVASSEDAAAEPRTITNKKAFSFTINVSADNANADIAGKTLRFVITPENYVAPLYDDASINVYTRELFEAPSQKQEIEAGDAVFLSVIAMVDKSAFYTNTSAFFFMGDNSLFPGFDEWLIGKKIGSYTYTATFSENAFTGDNAFSHANGKTAEFYINITKICETEDVLAANGFDTVLELKDYYSILSFAKMYLCEKAVEESTVNSYPEKAVAAMEAQMREQTDGVIAGYREYLEEYLGEVSDEYVFSYMQKEVFGEELYKDAEDLISSVSRDQMDYIIISNAIADSLGIEYSVEEYRADMQEMLNYSGNFESTIEEAESGMLGRNHYYYAYFLTGKIADTLAEKIMQK